MKRVIFIVIALVMSFSAFSQTYLTKGDNCFNKGDYACAKTNYSEALKTAKANDRMNIEIKRGRAERCADYLKDADAAFAGKRYQVAKDKYEELSKANPNDPYARSQIDKCESILRPPITLSVSKESLLLPASGGTERITLTTNASSYSIKSLPSWCTTQRQAGSFTVTCAENTTSAERTGYYIVEAGDKTARINVRQSGKTQTTATPPLASTEPSTNRTQTPQVQPRETTLSVSPEHVNFSSRGGSIKEIDVYTNASAFSVTGAPSWCSVEMYDDYFAVSCSMNNSAQPRSARLRVEAGNKEVIIPVNQAVDPNRRPQDAGEPTRYSSQSTSAYRNGYPARERQKKPARNKIECFNCPLGVQRPIGISVGYIQKQLDPSSYAGSAHEMGSALLNGFQLGLRVEPLFKYGFGLSTGFFYDYYTSESIKKTGYDSDGTDYYLAFNEQSFSFPFHLEYRANISNEFQFFVEVGPSFHFGLVEKLTATEANEKNPSITETNIFSDLLTDPTDRINLSFDLGAGIRYNGLQLNVGTRGLLKQSTSYVHNNPNNLFISLSWMFRKKH